MTASGRRGRVLRRGRSRLTFTHASQPFSCHAAPPRMWLRLSSGLSCHTRQPVPRRSPSHRLPSAPRGRRARGSPTTAYSRFSSHQTSAHGRPSCARTWPTSHTRFQRCSAIAIGHLTRSRALLVAAERRDGATVVKTRPPPAQPRVVAGGVCPVCRLGVRRRGRATWACAAARRYAWREPRPAPEAGRLHADVERTASCPRWLTHHRPAIQALSAPTVPGQLGRAPPEDAGSRLPDGLTRGGASASPRSASAIAPRPHGHVDETCAGRLLRDGQGATRSRSHVHPDGPVLRGAVGSRAVAVTAVDDQHAPEGGTRGDPLGGPPLRQHGLHPRTTGR